MIQRLAPYLLISLVLPIAGCVTTIDLPDVGPCAGYPEGLYDYGDLSVGTCLAGPVDLQTLEQGSDWRLIVANANPNLLFTSGSILALDGEGIETIAEAGAESVIAGGAPPVHLVNTLAIDAEDTRSFSGPVVWDETRNTFFYTNRLSFTTATSSPDRVEGMTFSGDVLTPYLGFQPYDYTYTASDGDEEEVFGDESYIEVGEDPYAIARNPETGALYVVNSTSRSVITLDTQASSEPVGYLRTVVGAQYPYPILDDRGLPSTLEFLAVQALPESMPTDTWELTYLEPMGRFLYPIEWGGTIALGIAETGDGLRWQPNGDVASLTPYEETVTDADGVSTTERLGFDADGIVSAFVGLNDTDYLVFYEGVRDGVSSIGFAQGNDRLTDLDRLGNASLEGGEDGGLILPAGPDDFDLMGAASPSVLRPGGETFRLWYTAYDAAGQARIARAVGDNAVEFEKEGVVFEGADIPGASESTDVADPLVFLRQELRGLNGFLMYYVEGDLDTGTCLRLAESPEGDTVWIAGGEDNVAPGCLLSEEDGLPPILRSPTLTIVGNMLRLWVSGADSPEGPWRVFSARSFDAISWEYEGEVDILAPPPGLPAAPAVPKAVTIMPVIDTVVKTRVETDNRGFLAAPRPGEVYGFGGLFFTVLEGHVLPAPWVSKPWWGSPRGRSADSQLAMGEPAALPDLTSLTLSVVNDSEEQYRIGRAFPNPGVGQEPYSAWAVPLGGEGASFTAGGGLSVHSPWLLRPDADNDDKVWLYYHRENADGSNQLVRRESLDGGVTYGAPASLTFTSFDNDEGDPQDPSVVVGHDGRYHLWYAATFNSINTSLRHAVSDDGLSFESALDGLIPVGQAGTWDDAGLFGPSVIWDEDAQVYRLWYSGDDGARVRIGYAEGTVSGENISFQRNEVDGRRTPVFTVGSALWDLAGVYHPMVVQLAADRFELFFEGKFTDDTRRIGHATSRDGITWVRTFAPGTSGDSFTFSSSTGRGIDTGNPKLDSTLSLVTGTKGEVDGATASAMAMLNIETRDGLLPCFGIITTRETNYVYLIDTFDDSASKFGGRPGPCVEATNPDLYDSAGTDWVDTNVNRTEEVFSLRNDLSLPGTRGIAQSPDGKTLYISSPNFDSLLIVDTDYFLDDDLNQVGARDLPLIGNVELARGATDASSDPDADDLIVDIRTDIGPTDIAVSLEEDGRYVFVANANEASVYTIDLARGSYGQVIKTAERLGLVPSALTLSPGGEWLIVASYVGDVDGAVVNSTMAVIDARSSSPAFGQVVAEIKNREL